MSIKLLREINDLVVEAEIERPDHEILSLLGSHGFPTLSQLSEVQAALSNAISLNRAERLSQAKLAFNRHIEDSERTFLSSRSLSMTEMLQDIVKAMQDPDKVPEGLLLAFREQSQNQAVSEDDIREIWESFARLGLIDSDENHD